MSVTVVIPIAPGLDLDPLAEAIRINPPGPFSKGVILHDESSKRSAYSFHNSVAERFHSFAAQQVSIPARGSWNFGFLEAASYGLRQGEHWLLFDPATTVPVRENWLFHLSEAFARQLNETNAETLGPPLKRMGDMWAMDPTVVFPYDLLLRHPSVRALRDPWTEQLKWELTSLYAATPMIESCPESGEFTTEDGVIWFVNRAGNKQRIDPRTYLFSGCTDGSLAHLFAR